MTKNKGREITERFTKRLNYLIKDRGENILKKEMNNYTIVSREINKALSNGASLQQRAVTILISGINGVGKTEEAKQLFKEICSNN